jgi:hypothetical protein
MEVALDGKNKARNHQPRYVSKETKIRNDFQRKQH